MKHVGNVDMIMSTSRIMHEGTISRTWNVILGSKNTMIKGHASGQEGHKVGDRVCHYRDDSLMGTIVIVEENMLSCMVEWDHMLGCGLDFQWSNKLIML